MSNVYRSLCFPNLKDFFEKQKCTVAVEIYCSEVEKVYNEFERRFKDIQKLEPVITFLSFPFSETNSIENISTQISNLFDMNSTKFESEIIKTKSDIFLKARGSETNFWNLLSEEKYPDLRNVTLQLHSFILDLHICAKQHFLT